MIIEPNPLANATKMKKKKGISKTGAANAIT
jgi:hypothetical protein